MGMNTKATCSLQKLSTISRSILFFFMLLALCFVHPQPSSAAPVTTTTEDEPQTTETPSKDEEDNSKSSLTTGQQFTNFMSTYFKPIASNTNLFFTAGITFCLSTGDRSISAPSPLKYSFGVGYSFHLVKFLLFQPRITGWSQYYLWDEDTSYAYPAPVEDRTATTLNALIDLPLVIPVGTKKNMMGLGLGAAVLARYGFLSNGVSADDTGSSGNAKSDVDLINSWLWSSARWLYPEMFISYNHLLTNGWRLGGEMRFYLPIGSLISGHGMDGMMCSVSLRLVLPE
jgi:hypothetical protein